MIAAIVLTLQLGAAAAPITVRMGERAYSLAVVAGTGQGGIRADVMAAALGGTVTRGGSGLYTLRIGGTAIELEAGLPLARVATTVVPLAGMPWQDGSALYVPPQVLTELVPRFAGGFQFDASRREIRSLSASAAAPPTPGVTPDVTRVAERSPVRRPGAGRTVVIDPGHGGRDPGGGGPMTCAGRTIHEKDIVLTVSKLLAQELREAGLKVVMTRTTDTLIALHHRGPIANRARGDLFLSLHVNSAPTTWRNPTAVRGFETYFLAEAKTEDARRVEEMENSAVRFETEAEAPKGDPLSFIINDMAQNEHLRESMDLAESVQHGLRRVHPGPSRGVKQANLAVLRGAFMPAVLVEIGFGKNREDAAFMCSTTGQRRLASAIASAAIEYLGHYEQRVGNGR